MIKRILMLTISLGFMLFTTAPILVSAISADDYKALLNWPFYDPSSAEACSVSGATVSGSAGGGLSSGSSIYILGDSITNGASKKYISVFNEKGITAVVNGSDSRSITGAGQTAGKTTSGLQAAVDDATDVHAAKAIVIALGTNGGTNEKNITDLIGAIKTNNTSAPIYWVDVIGTNSNKMMSVMRDANRAINNNASGQGNNKIDTVISWFDTVSPDGDSQNPTATEPDPNNYISTADGLNVHPTPEGYTALVNLVYASVAGGPVVTSPTTGQACLTPGGNTLPGNDNAEKVWNYLIGKGLTPVQVAAFMGNLQAEAHFDPKLVQYDRPKASGGISHPCKTADPNDTTCHDDTLLVDGNTGYGIAQWTSSGRQQALLDFAKSKGTIAGDLTTQLDFLWSEVTTTFNRSVLQPLQATNDIRAGTDIVLRKFECPRACVNLAENPNNETFIRAYQSVLTTRTGMAQAILVKYGSL